MADRAPLAGKVIVIAGSSSEAGLAVAERLSADGATVVALGSNAERLEPVRAADRRVVDLRDADAVAAVAAGILADHGRVDGVVHLVGGWSSGHGETGWQTLLANNVTTLRNTSLAFRDALLASGDGRFVMISSTTVDSPTWGNANYVTSKAAAEAWTRVFSHNWKDEATAAATILVVKSLGDGPGRTPVGVLAERIAGLWALPFAELNGARIVL
jgi:NAD(P)-dependent dehydrogenase (short-subunit alcohol dehydrogenase family)